MIRDAIPNLHKKPLELDSQGAVTDYIEPGSAGEKIESLTTVNFGDQAPEKASSL